MKTLRIALLVALPLALGAETMTKDAHAATSCDATSCTGPIRELYIFGDGDSMTAQVRLDEDNRPTTGQPININCTLESGAYWNVGSGKNNVIRALLAAQLAGRAVTLREVSNNGTCSVAYVALK
jgi:hypothetical protein